MMLMMMIIARQRNPNKIRSGFKNLKKIIKAKKANKINNNIFINFYISTFLDFKEWKQFIKLKSSLVIKIL